LKWSYFVILLRQRRILAVNRENREMCSVMKVGAQATDCNSLYLYSLVPGDSWQEQEVLLFLSVPISQFHPALYPVGTEDSAPGLSG
jgi:hypothetical protein